ncbi:uncharacterized protein EDB91DRAFT_1238616 [Suillus paluster]|uniref:uncharacterized protein n=1 Tax=Suillus paluster TaxID=48578 RepID=UPI001B85F32F|nr:uncharacterized protein EDB91DRAFT_1238616 [Suillus paluster]KAG1733403.1 hypothetical protein EDB91DRAFT_1238616 [Suillus paluster]
MAMHTIKGANLTGTQCIFREQGILRVRVASISSPHLMSLHVAQDMLTIFIATKPLRNISHFGMPISNYLWDHYQEALKSVWLLTAELETIKAELHLSDDDFPGFFDQECIYLDNRLSIHYVEVLDELVEQRAEWDFTHESGNNALTGVDAGIDSSYAKLQHAKGLVAHCECVLSVDERWVIGGKEYNRFKEEVTLDELEHLVVMRLFELSKLSLSGTGLSYFKLCRAHEEVIQLNIEICWL